MAVPAGHRRNRVLLGIAFVIALAFTGFHVARTIRDARYWREHRDEPIAGWMTIGYVAHSYHVPPHVLLLRLGLPPGPPPARDDRGDARRNGRSGRGRADRRDRPCPAALSATRAAAETAAAPMNDILLGLLTSYGLPALFGILLVTSAGVPFPDSLLLIAVGSFVAQGDLDFGPVVAVATLGAVAGDQIGYALGYWGGRPLAARLGGSDRIAKAEAFSSKWSGPGIFFSRWLVGPLGPWINLTSGITAYPWLRFVLLDIAGELIWVVLYVGLGRAFSDKVQTIADLLGNLTWVILGLAATGVIGWKLFKRVQTSASDATMSAGGAGG